MKRIVFGERRTPNIALLPTITYDSFHSDGYKIAEIGIWFIHWKLCASIVIGKKKEQEYGYYAGAEKES